MQKAAATVVVLPKLPKGSTGVMCRAARVCNLCILCHKQCSLPRDQSVASALCLWLLTECTRIHDFSSCVFLEECLLLECAAWLKENWSTQLNVSYTDFSKSSTNACKFHLAIFVCLNSPCAFFPVISLLAGVWSYPQRHLLAGTR